MQFEQDSNLKDLKSDKELYWYTFINSFISQDLQSLYRDEINKMRGAFEEGVKFGLNYRKNNQYDRQKSQQKQG